jgi:hypothetical protein
MEPSNSTSWSDNETTNANEMEMGDFNLSQSNNVRMLLYFGVSGLLTDIDESRCGWKETNRILGTHEAAKVPRVHRHTATHRLCGDFPGPRPYIQRLSTYFPYQSRQGCSFIERSLLWRGIRCGQ